MALKSLKSLGNQAAQPLAAQTPLSAPDGAAQQQKKRHRITIQREIIVLLAMLVFNLLFTQHFWSLQTFNVNLTQVVTIVIVGIGMTLVVATGGIDLSVGASMAISGAAARRTSGATSALRVLSESASHAGLPAASSPGPATICASSISCAIWRAGLRIVTEVVGSASWG